MNTVTSNLSLKLKLVYLPFLIIAFGFLIGYSLLNWLLVIQFDLLKATENVVNIWAPAGLSAIMLLIFFNPRLKLLALKTKKADLPGLYFFIVLAAVSVPTICAQFYLASATGTLTKLNKIEQIGSLPASKYYQVKHFKIDTVNIGVYRRVEVTGKNSEHLTLYIDVVCPVTDSMGRAFAWLGTEYSKGISNNLSDAEKEQAFKDHNAETFNKFQTEDLTRFIYLRRVPHSEKANGFKHALEGKDGAELALLEAVNEPYEARNGSKFAWMIGSFLVGNIIWLLLVIITKLNPAALKKFMAPRKPNVRGPVTIMASYFKVENNMLVTGIIAGLNIIVFIVMVFAGLGFMSFSADDLLNWGANFGPLVREGEVWRLFTAMFLHGGLMHVFMNLYGLLFAAIFLEPLIGRWRFATAYLICGLFGSLNSLWWHPDTVGVGASGAIFGLYGVILPLLLAKRTDPVIARVLIINFVIFVGVNLLLGMRGNVDNSAHLGGLISGLIIGTLLIFLIPKHQLNVEEKQDD